MLGLTRRADSTAEDRQWTCHAFRSHRPDDTDILIDFSHPNGNVGLKVPEDVAKSIHHKIGEAIDDAD